MTQFKRIIFTQKEYDKIKGYVNIGDKELAKLQRKMENAMIATEETGMAVVEFIKIAKVVLGDRLKLANDPSIAWQAKTKNFLAANNITEDIVKKGSLYAKANWRGAIYIDDLLYRIIKFSAMPLFKPEEGIKTGFAQPLPDLEEDGYDEDGSHFSEVD